MLALFRYRVPFYIVLIAFMLCAVTAATITKKMYNSADSVGSNPTQSSTHDSQCDFTTPRLGGYTFIKPLLFAEQNCESEKLNGIKTDIASYLDPLKANGTLSAASVYLQDMQNDAWTGYNPDEQHNPGSLLKVPEMMTLFKTEEVRPGFLQKQISASPSLQVAKEQTRYLSKTIDKNRSYSILELMKYMIGYSDNSATLLLNTQITATDFKKTFTDIGLPSPDLAAQDCPISAKEYSLFLKVLYNASYLTIAHSEQATAIMSTCDFKDGFYKGLPEGTKMAHKYGMARYNNDHELGESALIFVNNNAYILTVFTRGKDPDKLPAVLQQIAGKVYNNIAAGNL